MARSAEPVASGGRTRPPQATALAAHIAQGALSAEELTAACLAQIDAREQTVQAWAWLDSDHALAQARERDRHRQSGLPLGPLHGVPVGIKDIIDTESIPTECGATCHKGRTPVRDAVLVEKLRAAGAVVLGKTVTAELAFLHPGKTRNPIDPEHTPGGSSSGSAAAVAAGMVPLAVGTQTGGSVIRPAAYCGVVGYKPSFGAIPRTGVLSQSPSLDTVGVFANSVADAALLADCLFGFDPADRATHRQPFPRLLEAVRAGPPLKPVFAIVRTPFWDQTDAATKAAFEELARFLGDAAFAVELPEVFARAPAIREQINLAEMAKQFRPLLDSAPALLSEAMREALAAGQRILAHDYLAALDWPGMLNSGLEEVFTRCDAILTPASAGAAPRGLQSTGSSLFNATWTLCGCPAITLPVFESQGGLPMGLQLVGRRGHDGRLLRTAQWLMQTLAEAGPDDAQ